jgi:hypothetical protein
MIYFVTHLKDNLQNNFLGIKFDTGIIEPYLEELKEYLGEDNFKLFNENHLKTNGMYFLSLINTNEYNQLLQDIGISRFVNSLDSVLKFEIDDLKMMGIGTATKNENRSYYIVCKSEKLDAVRKRYELKEFDFHITIGFKWKDVVGVRKNEMMKKNNKFLNLLKAEFYKKDNWDFIKSIGNYDLDPKAEIIPVKLSDTNLKVKAQGHYMDITYLEDVDKFWIVTKYSVDEEMPRLAETEIARILNKK